MTFNQSTSEDAMLTFIWTTLLIGAAIGAGYLFDLLDGPDADAGSSVLLLGTVSSLIAVGLQWDVVFRPTYDWIDAALPERGAAVHDFTAVLLQGVFVVACTVAPMVLGLAIGHVRARLMDARINLSGELEKQ